MSIKENLQEYSKLCSERKQLEEIIERINYRLEKPHIAIYSYTRESAENICLMQTKLVEISESYAEKLKSISDRLSDTEDIISSLENPLYRVILRSRYIDSLSWYDIADRTGYEWAQIHRLHKKAISELEKSKFSKNVH